MRWQHLISWSLQNFIPYYPSNGMARRIGLFVLFFREFLGFEFRGKTSPLSRYRITKFNKKFYNAQTLEYAGASFSRPGNL